jgi:hypothetical protein
MASILSAGTTNSTALNLTADTSGSLILASNNNVTAVTIATNQSVTFANNATFPTTIGVGGATPSANGSGISFPATQSASSDANTLDDYEEGTWTPSIGGTATYTSQEGKYTKIGNLVMISCQIAINLIGTGSTTTITGLPFSSARSWFGGGCTYETVLATSVVELRPSLQGASSDIIFLGRTAASTLTTSAITVFQNNAAIYFSGTYLVV